MIRENDKVHIHIHAHLEVQHNESIHCVYIVHSLLLISSLEYIYCSCDSFSVAGSYKSFYLLIPNSCAWNVVDC